MNAIQQNDFYNYRFLSNLTYSKTGRNLLVTVKMCDVKNNGYKNTVYALKDRKFRKLTEDFAQYLFTDDENLLFFGPKNREEKERLKNGEIFTPVYRMNMNDYQPEKAFDIPFAVEYAELLDKDSLLIVSTINKNYPDYYKMSAKERKAVEKAIADDKDYETVDESPFYFNGAGYTNGFRTALFIFNMKTRKAERITEPLFAASCFKVVKDKIYIGGETLVDKSDFYSDLVVYDLKSRKTRVLIKKEIGIYDMELLDDRLFVYGSDMKKYGLNQNPVFYEYDFKENQFRLFYDEDMTVGNSSGTDCRLGGSRTAKVFNGRIYFVETRRNNAILTSLDANGRKEDIYVSDDSVEDFDISENGIVMTLLKEDTLQDVYQLKDGKAVRISAFNSLKGKYVAKPEKITVISENTDIDGWILKPINYDPKKKYPAVLDVHGGPKTIYSNIYYHEMQVWASLGYFVFFCNPTGSDGRGNEFADIRGKYGTIDYQNIMDFTDEVLKKYPQINRKKVCLTGGSYGGFMTNWIVGHTDRFVCAATQRSISNWISFEGVSDIGPFFATDQTQGGLFINLEKSWQQSPLKYVENVKTPLLFIHSDEDYRCPIEQGIQYYTALKVRGIETKMVIFHGENHELSRGGKPLHRARRLKEITDWFNSHI